MTEEQNIQKITNELQGGFQKDKACIPESIFVEYFLPYFTGEIAIDDESIILAKWIDLAGSPYSSVDLIDKNNNVVGEVPGIFSHGSTGPRDQRTPMSTVIRKTEHLKTISPVRSREHMVRELNNYKTTADPNNDDRWQNLFRKYKQPDQQIDTVTTIHDDTPQENLGDFLEY